MATQYTIDALRGVVFTTFSGAITFEEVVAHAVALRGDPIFHPAFTELLDLREVTYTNLTFQELERLSHTIDPFSRTAQRAIVASSDLMYETSRMYQKARDAGENVRVFRTIDEAREWLDGADSPADLNRRSA
ncbi:MAG TPA: hypothetical protein VG498_22635 [Terriglobales bacterium]|nr:hypothetical protein [Terriglobales bacterium]